MNKFIFKYFYSWYLIPIILLHESCHILVARILGIRLLQFKLYKIPVLKIYNAFVKFEYNKHNWKWNFVMYAPLILLIPVFLMFLNSFFFYIGLYFLSTIIIINKKIIWICIPSLSDLKFKHKLKYYSYLVDSTSEKIFNLYLKENKLNILIKDNHLMNECEFIEIKINKKQ